MEYVSDAIVLESERLGIRFYHLQAISSPTSIEDLKTNPLSRTRVQIEGSHQARTDRDQHAADN